VEDEVGLKEANVVGKGVVEEVCVSEDGVTAVLEGTEGSKETHCADLGCHYLVEVGVGAYEIVQ